MKRLCRSFCGASARVAFFAAGWYLIVPGASAAEVLMKDGRVLQGRLAPVAGLAEVPRALGPDGIGPIRLILLLDDDLRRTFVSKRQMQKILQGTPGQVEEKFRVWQPSPRTALQVKSVGPVLSIDPFDEFGRRNFHFNTARGPVAVTQGITLLTPKWAKVEGQSHIWDMRIATSSIPRDVLHKILLKQIDPDDIEHHKKIARFYLQSERYKQAREALEGILKAFPNEAALDQQLAPSIRALRQLEAQRMLSELKLRRTAGQHATVLQLLKSFPADDVAGEILQEVRETVQQYESWQARRDEVLQRFDELLAAVKDPAIREKIGPMREEIRAEINVNTLVRMTSFMQSADAPNLLPQEKLSIAVSGWLLGSDAATENLTVTLSVYKVRSLVRRYLNEPAKMNRAGILALFGSEEGAVPELVAGLLAHMKPAVDPPEPVSPGQPGLYKLEVSTFPQEPPVGYLVQLPPQYDPYRLYPTILTLHGAGTNAEQQVDWWAGGWNDKGLRAGQATRHGYIVIAPQWATEHQKGYDYSAREHAAVLGSLRDACRRFAIDTDRVFLTGHSMGGDAAWDLGLAHPDLWAGVIPIVARADRYCTRYWENAQHLPFYVVAGELDGNRLTHNATDLDRYLKRGYNCTVVEYLGRGHEHFYDEILRIFDCMGRFRRNFFPRDFTCTTMREWDDYFWWVEIDGLPARSTVDPEQWPPPRGTQPVQVTGKVLNSNGVNVRTGAARASVWLSPQIIDFQQRMMIVINNRRIDTRDVKPSLQTMLEDVRTRGDRQHPFWAKVE